MIAIWINLGKIIGKGLSEPQVELIDQSLVLRFEPSQFEIIEEGKFMMLWFHLDKTEKDSAGSVAVCLPLDEKDPKIKRLHDAVKEQLTEECK